jgi:hypothetical protein
MEEEDTSIETDSRRQVAVHERGKQRLSTRTPNDGLAAHGRGRRRHRHEQQKASGGP